MKRPSSIPPIQLVTIAKIQTDKSEKTPKTRKEIKAIEEGFEDHGQIYSIVVTKSPNETITLEAGAKRLEAARNLGWKEIKATVIPLEEDDDPDLIKEWVKLIEGHQRYELDDFSMAKAAVFMEEKFKVKGSDFARQLGLSNGYVYNLMRWYRCAPDKVREAWRQAHPHINQAELEEYSHMTKAEALEAWNLRLRMRTSDMMPFQPNKKNGKLVETKLKPRRASERQIGMLQEAIDASALIAPVKDLCTAILKFVLGVESNVPGITNYQKLPLVLIDKDAAKPNGRSAKAKTRSASASA